MLGAESRLDSDPGVPVRQSACWGGAAVPFRLTGRPPLTRSRRRACDLGVAPCTLTHGGSYFCLVGARVLVAAEPRALVSAARVVGVAPAPDACDVGVTGADGTCFTKSI